MTSICTLEKRLSTLLSLTQISISFLLLIISWEWCKQSHDNVNENYMLDLNFIKSTFSSENIYLSNWWVDRIIQSSLMTKRRCQYWFENFDLKEYVLVSWKNKKSSYKIENEKKVWWYIIATEWYQLHETKESELKIVKEKNWMTNKKLILDDEVLIQKDSFIRFHEVIKEDMKKIEAELIRTKKQKIIRSLLSFETAFSSMSVESRIRSNAEKLTRSKKLIKLFSFINVNMLIKVIRLIKLIKFIKSVTSLNQTILSKKKKNKRILEVEEDSQRIIKNESKSDSQKKQKIALSSIKNHNLYLVSSDLKENEILKHMKLLRDFLVHAKAYRLLINLIVIQLRLLLKANSFLKLLYDQLRNEGNMLIEKQAILRGRLEKVMKEES